MSVTRVFPPPVEQREAMPSRDWLLAAYAPVAAASVRVNMVASLNGSATGADGTSNSLTNRLDRRILGVIRELSDVVLVGAASVRLEGYVVPSKAALAVLTTTGDLRGNRFRDREMTQPILVLCPRSRLARVQDSPDVQGATVVGIDDDAAPGEARAEALLAALRDRGFAHIVCEGGPRLAGSLFAADLVDEFCLTTSPRITLGERELLGPGGAGSTDFSLRQLLLEDSGTSYARWARERATRS